MSGDVTLMGFGEAGSTFARAGQWGGLGAGLVLGFDLLDERRAAMAELGVAPCSSPTDAVGNASLVLSLVTADQALVAAQAAAPHLVQGAIWCDMNSVAPETKRKAADVIETAGGRYVDVAIMAPVDLLQLAVPLLLAGPEAANAQLVLAALGFSNLCVVGEDVGRASVIKMIRSVMLKGVEALTAEMLLAAERADVSDEVLASLDAASEKSRGWRDKADYCLERMFTHGIRRAAEMEEAARTLASLGVEPVMTEGTVRRQREMAGRQFKRSAVA